MNQHKNHILVLLFSIVFYLKNILSALKRFIL